MFNNLCIQISKKIKPNHNLNIMETNPHRMLILKMLSKSTLAN